jgi:hypothetical protein
MGAGKAEPLVMEVGEKLMFIQVAVVILTLRVRLR